MPCHPARVVPDPGPSPALTLTAIALLAVALCCNAQTAQAADSAAKPVIDATVRVKALPPSIVVDAKTDPDAGSSEATESPGSSKSRSAHIRIDSDKEFDEMGSQFEKDPSRFIDKNPWVIGLIFLVVGSIFLTPVVLVVGIIWYKLRKTRLQNEAMLALAEKGVVPPAQAAEALATGTPPATVAPQIYQQAVALRKRVVWSDLRKGIILTMLGLGSSLYSVTADTSPNWLGLVLIFVGLGYIALWWLEGRQLERTGGTAGDGGAKPGGS